jgi:hypothetical protein
MPEKVELYVVKFNVTFETTAPAGIVDKSKLAQPLLLPEFILIIAPPFLVPALLTEPDLKDAAVPVEFMVTVVCPRTLPIPATKIARVSIKDFRYTTCLPDVADSEFFSFEFFQTVHLRLLDFLDKDSNSVFIEYSFAFKKHTVVLTAPTH